MGYAIAVGTKNLKVCSMFPVYCWRKQLWSYGTSMGHRKCCPRYCEGCCDCSYSWNWNLRSNHCMSFSNASIQIRLIGITAASGRTFLLTPPTIITAIHSIFLQVVSPVF
ncbi:mfs transporter [Moniliophthora roreri]|nr:mfs transporter [Moniliophthora roreri]